MVSLQRMWLLHILVCLFQRMVGCIRGYCPAFGTRIIGGVTSEAPMCRCLRRPLIILAIVRNLCVKRIRMTGIGRELGLKKGTFKLGGSGISQFLPRSRLFDVADCRTFAICLGIVWP